VWQTKKYAIKIAIEKNKNDLKFLNIAKIIAVTITISMS